MKRGEGGGGGRGDGMRRRRGGRKVCFHALLATSRLVTKTQFEEMLEDMEILNITSLMTLTLFIFRWKCDIFEETFSTQIEMLFPYDRLSHQNESPKHGLRISN